MKYGFIWFLHLDAPIQLARIIMVPCLIWGFFATIRSIFFIIAWTLFAVSLLITLCTFFMHIPSTEKVEKVISQYEKDFLEKQKREFRDHKNVEILELKCFAANKVLRLSRWIGKQKIYDTLVMFAWIKTQEGLWLAYDEKPLWIDTPSDRKCYEIQNPSDVKIEKSITATGDLKVSLQINGDRFLVTCKDDYHFRDFVDRYNITVLD